MKSMSKVLKEKTWQSAPGPVETNKVLCSPDCSVCGGVGYIRYDVPFGDHRFGKLYPCPNIPPESSLHHNHGLTASEIRSLDWSSLVGRENVQDGIAAVSRVLERGS